MPAAGFHTVPCLYFSDEADFPRASMCDVSITFPRALAVLTYICM